MTSTGKFSTLASTTRLAAFVGGAALLLTLGACGSDDEDPAGTAATGGSSGSGGTAGGTGGGGTGGATGGTGGSTSTWECDADHADWERCEENKVQYCHIVSGMDPHFHWGMDCEAQGYQCHDDGMGEATCVDTSQTCTDGEFRCEDNTAYNCIDGKMGIEPCGTAKHCHEEADEAHCEETGDECGGHGHVHDNECHCDEGYELDPADPLNCIASVPFPQLACDQFQNGTVEQKQVATTFADVFSPDTHADLDVPVEVTLPDNATSYIHFPVLETGDYVLFFNTTGAFETVLHRGDMVTGTAVSPPPSGGTPNGMCETVLTEHWHAELEYDGDGSGPVPYVIEFKPTSPQTVRFIIKHHEE